jgi:DNA primase
MALIKKSSVEEAVAASDMIEVVSARTPLRRAGARWTGRCPFHEERTPSFSVNPAEKLYYCFGCHKGGDLISFVRETEGLDFAGAVEWLADRYRLQLEYEESSPRADANRRRRERLLALLDAAGTFYSRYLWESQAAEPARAYLAERGFAEEVVRTFRLGLSPGGGVAAAKARARGYTQDELVAAGLVNRRGNDYFAGRLVFPLADARGRILGFGARRLSEADPIRAKYVNSPDGELFHKASVVYGLHRARTAIAKQDRAIVVEGYTDVLALHQAGVETAVAAMGTALTEAQLKELARLTQTLFLCFDADAAGADATLRGMDLAYQRFREVRVVTLPAGEDPASSLGAFERRLDDAEAYPVYRVKLEIDRASSREQAFEALRAIMRRFDQNTEWMDAVRYAANRLDLPPALHRELAPRPTAATGELRRKLFEAGVRLERDFLAACAGQRELAERYVTKVDDRHFDVELHRRLRSLLAGDESVEDPDVIALRAELDAVAEREQLGRQSAAELFLRLEERLVRRQLAELGGDDLERTVELQGLLAKIRESLQQTAF